MKWECFTWLASKLYTPSGKQKKLATPKHKLKPWPNGVASRRKLKTCICLPLCLASSCVHLGWLVLTLVEIKFARKSTHVFHHLAIQPKSTQIDWRPFTYYYPMNTGYVCLEMGFLWLACTCEETCKSMWPPNASLYASSTCVHLQPLAGLFGQGLTRTHDPFNVVRTYLNILALMCCCSVYDLRLMTTRNLENGLVSAR